MGLAVDLFFLLLAATTAQGFVYSCEEVKYQLINANTGPVTQYACIALEVGFTNFNQLKNIFVQNSGAKTSLFDLAKSCERSDGTSKWTLVSNGPINLDCNEEFTLFFSYGSPLNLNGLTMPTNKPIYFDNSNFGHGGQGLISPRGGMRLTITKCTGTDEVQFFTGIGDGTGEARFPLQSWTCADIPRYIISFDTAVSIMFFGNNIGFYHELHDFDSELNIDPGQKIAILTSGRSDNLQNMLPNRNGVKFASTGFLAVSTSYDLSFDSRYNGNVSILIPGYQQSFGSSNGTYDFTTTSFEVHYNTIAVAADEIWDSEDNVVIEMTTIAASPPPSTTAPKTTQTTPATGQPGPYCGCGLDRFLMADGWDTKEIWIDLVIILDTSEAMGEDSLEDAGSLIESLIGDDADDYDVLITDPTATFYTRVGLIAMSNKAEVLYNLNMTKYDKVNDKAKLATGVSQINVLDAFDAAFRMFNDGLVSQPKRSDVRQIIYYLTDSDPKVDLSPLNQFKASQGVIIVNNYQMNGEVERPGLKKLASDGYYYTGLQENYMFSIQAFCKTNCFCKEDRVPYAGSVVDAATKVAGGCYHPAPSGIPFSKARQACTNNRGGLIASPHDNGKAQFLDNLLISTMPVPKPYFFWIGYSKLDDGANWKWEDGSSDVFTNWAADEPNSASVAKCAYVDQSSTQLQWGAGNCQVGFPYVCEYAPCSVGNKDC